MAHVLQLRRMTKAAWTACNAVLAPGEPGEETDTGQLKIGDGVTAWNLLPYVGTGGAGGIAEWDATVDYVDGDVVWWDGAIYVSCTPPPFTPPAITGLVAWWDFSDATKLYTDAGVTLVTTDGDLIYQANDKSGVGNHAVQTVLATRPSYKTARINSLSTALNALGKGMNVPNAFGALTAATRFYVAKAALDPPAAASTSMMCNFGSSGSDDHTPFSDGVVYDGFGSTTRRTVGNLAPSLASPRVFVTVSAAADWRYWVDGGAPVFSTGVNTVGWDPAPNLGIFHGANQSYVGDMAEAIIYNSKLSLADINQVGQYLATKWGTTWTAAT
jgi:hypothetical protein